ncbi:RagB/SusD family nutrient uptake outer membrane protein [Pedobacter hartonius]|uniref:SusD family protein n=1 Tax=Pedobacter hartonius TaxID=425514 RepID=A0A1H4HJ05_9SPHI|nr:RagB/SusD family nutrient uptake outer membrane protein [Pedobacter hartonius]SEB21655.1 SusD family protein [Pedobacter hartonius]
MKTMACITLNKKFKSTLLFTTILLFSGFNFSCEKFVDIKKNSSQSLIETADDCQQILDNYSQMNTLYPSDGELSADDYYLGEEGYLNPDVGQEERNLYAWMPTAIRGSASQWQSAYLIVYHANLVLETVEKLKGSADQSILDGLRGSALFFRSFAFWQVAQLYAKPYTIATALQDPGIPLRLNSDINGVSSRGTVSQTYERIIQDLQEAVTLLQPTSIVSSRPNKAAAYAMLARTYLSMEDYPQALINANLALQINSTLVDYNTINRDVFVLFSPRFSSKEVIFHSVTSLAPILNPGSAANNVAKIDPSLVASYASNDLRSVLFLKQNTSNVNVPDTPGSSDSTSVTANDGTYRFTGNYEPNTRSIFFNGLAVDELYLIRAECYARANNVTAALGDLNTLLSSRWNNTSVYQPIVATNVDDALSKVLIERRKELLMRSLRWTDLRRLNHDARFKKDLVRKVVRITPKVIGSISTGYIISFDYPAIATYSLPANDLRYTLLIPNEVIINSSLTQNPR